MKNRHFLGTIALLTLAAFAALVFSWSQVPTRVPTHWNARGQIDAWGPRWTLWLIACLPALMGGLFLLIPRFDPKRESYARHRTAFLVTLSVLVAIMALVFWLSFVAALGKPVNVALILPLALGLGFVAIGNFLPQVKANYFFGIRTPWTLSNEEVWRRTHRLGGLVFVAMGLCMAASAFAIAIGKPILVLLLLPLPLLGGTAFLFVYSWRLHRRLGGKRP